MPHIYSEKKKIIDAKYRERNRLRLRIYHKEWTKNNKDKTKIYGQNQYQKHKEYYKQKRKEALAKRLEWTNNLKREKGCSICGTKEKLEFHHRDQTTKIMNVSRMITCLVRMPVLLAEIEKCNIICFDCHIKTHKIEGRLRRRNTVY